MKMLLSRKLLPWLALAIVLIIGGFGYLHYQSLYPSTDDAYINANVVHIAAEVSGPVAKLYVQDHQSVKQGDKLFDIDPAPFAIAVKKAEANLKVTQQEVSSEKAAVKAANAMVSERKAELLNAVKDEKRTLPLVKLGQIAPTQGDQVIRARKVAQAALIAAVNNLHEAKEKLGDPNEANAQISEAKQELAQAQLDLGHTHITAPANGYLANFNIRQGSMVTAHEALFVLVDNKEWWVDANYKETDLARIQPNQTAKVTVDIYPHHTFQGHVQSISRGSGSAFSLLPQENATGNWVKITQRFPVKIVIENPSAKYPLRVGASCKVSIDTTKVLGQTRS